MGLLHWDTTLFSLLYSSIQNGQDYTDLLLLLRHDLTNLLVVSSENPASRNALDTKKISTSDGQTYELNNDFVLLALELSSELKIDQLVAAEILLNAKKFQDANNLTTSLLDAARIAYYKRQETIIYIFNYLVNAASLAQLSVLFRDLKANNFIIDNLLGSFKHIEAELEQIHESIRELKILEPNFVPTIEFKTRLGFRRNNLLNFHQLLGQVFYALVLNDHIDFINNNHFKQILNHLTTNFDADDSFVLHYLPGLYNYVISITKHQQKTQSVIQLYEYFNNELSTKNIETTLLKHPIKATVVFLFYCFMSNWLQGEWFTLEQQQANFDTYFNSMQISVLKLIKLGALEQLMVITSEVFSNDPSQYLLNHVQFYDIQSLLQKHIPKLIPKKVLDIDEERTKQLQELITSSRNNSLLFDSERRTAYPKIYLESHLNLATHKTTKILFHAIIDDFLRVFLSNFSNILIRICDSEEDFYLTNIKAPSSADLTIDELAENADLERLYMIMYFNFFNRVTPLNIWNKQYIKAEDTNFLEFLDWGIAKTTNTLIKSCFLVVLSALAENQENALHVYEFLNDDEILEDGNSSKLLLGADSSIASSLTGSKALVSVGEDKKDSKISWDFIFRSLKTQNLAFHKNYEKFINKFQNSYNQLLLPSSSIQTFHTFFGSKDLPTGPTATGATTNTSTAATTTTANATATSDLKAKENDITLEDLELSEEEIIELSSYFKLIYSSALNNTAVKELFYQRNNFELLDVLFDFLHNLTNIASLKSTFNPAAAAAAVAAAAAAAGGSNVEPHTNMKSETFLIGLILNVVKALVPQTHTYETIKIKNKIWSKLDEWVFKNKLSTVNNRNAKTPSFRNFFNNIFLEFNDVYGFLSLFEVLLSAPSASAKKDTDEDDFYIGNDIDGERFGLPFPKNLGASYRKAGIWPYIDYFLNDIFVNLTSKNLDVKRKNSLLTIILNISLSSFKYFNPLLPLTFRSAGISNLDTIIQGANFVEYLKENPATAVMNYAFSNKVRDVLFKCVSIGQDEISDKNGNDMTVQIVKLALNIMLRILKFEDTYINIVLPAMKKQQQSKSLTAATTTTATGASVTGEIFYLPHDIGTHGLKTFYNALSFNLPTIGHLGLYVNSNLASISLVSLELLDLIAKSPQFLVPNSVSAYASGNSSSLPLIKRNRLLTIFETIDESTRIRLAFVDQFEAIFTDVEGDEEKDEEEEQQAQNELKLVDESLRLKVKILNFINARLSESQQQTTLGEYLLGFEQSTFNKLTLGSSNVLGTIASSRSLFDSLMTTFDLCLEQYHNSPNSFNYSSVRLSSLILKIVLKLCKKPITSSLVLAHLEKNYNFYEKLIKNEPIIDLEKTRFSNEVFNNDFNDYGSNFTIHSTGMGALLSFLQNRSELLQFLTLELNRVSYQGSLLKIDHAVNSLINTDSASSNNFALNNAPKLLLFLDVLDFNIRLYPDGSLLASNLKYFDVETLVSIFQDNGGVLKLLDSAMDLNDINGTQKLAPVFDLRILNLALNLLLKRLSLENRYVSEKKLADNKLEVKFWQDLENKAKKAKSSNSSNIRLMVPTAVALDGRAPPIAIPASNQQEVLKEKDHIIKFVVNLQASRDFKVAQLASLHSWVQLIQVILLNDKLNDELKAKFALQVFELIIPRINSYYDYDINYSKELISLSISMFDVYVASIQKLNSDNGNENADLALLYERLYPLFQTCLNGITNKSLVPSLRSDLYALTDKYLLWVIGHDLFFRRIAKVIRLSNEKLLQIICTDISNGDDSNRVTALILLESFCRFSNASKVNFMVDYLVQNNFLVTLIRSIKRTDNLLALTTKNNNSGVTLDSLLYELTAFKATLYFLIRVSETKAGSNHLVQCDIFKTLQKLAFLQVDPDLGLDILLDEYSADADNKLFVRISLSLDRPLTLGKKTDANANVPSNKNGNTKISLFELFVPVFQLVTAILVSMGPSNKHLIDTVRDLLKQHHKLFIGVLKRHQLIELESMGGDDKLGDGVYAKGELSHVGLVKLSDLFVLLSALTDYKGGF